MNLTPKQLTILRLIRDSRVRSGYSPTMQELADELGVSKVTVFEHVALPDEEKPVSFPLIGKIAAGYPIEKFEDNDELNLAELFGPSVGRVNATYALCVDGDSMRDEGILDGDYVIVERRDTARNGDRVVALLPNGETTLKTYFKEADHIRLQPANPDFEPIRVKDCKIQGIVVGVMRRY